MTPDDFRRIALSLPGVEEKSHMGHPDFRVKSKIFATLGYPDAGHGMANVTVEQQHALVQADRAAFTPVPGVWGQRGCTQVRLQHASTVQVEEALRMAWEKSSRPAQRKRKRAI